MYQLFYWFHCSQAYKFLPTRKLILFHSPFYSLIFYSQDLNLPRIPIFVYYETVNAFISHPKQLLKSSTWNFRNTNLKTDLRDKKLSRHKYQKISVLKKKIHIIRIKQPIIIISKDLPLGKKKPTKLSFLIFSPSTGNWTPNLTLAKQASYHLNHPLVIWFCLRNGLVWNWWSYYVSWVAAIIDMRHHAQLL
jgi:hypothetical protein